MQFQHLLNYFQVVQERTRHLEIKEARAKALQYQKERNHLRDEVKALREKVEVAKADAKGRPYQHVSEGDSNCVYQDPNERCNKRLRAAKRHSPLRKLVRVLLLRPDIYFTLTPFVEAKVMLENYKVQVQSLENRLKAAETAKEMAEKDQKHGKHDEQISTLVFTSF